MRKRKASPAALAPIMQDANGNVLSPKARQAAEEEAARRAEIKISNPDLYSALYADDDEVMAGTLHLDLPTLPVQTRNTRGFKF